MFLDEATVRVRAGRGGNGLIHFASSRHNPKGGPDGGNGANGGDVILRASSRVTTLYSFRNRPLFAAASGVDGRRNTCHGARGEDLIVHVPIGTVVYDAESGDSLGDLTHDGNEILVATGGEGGRGNASFTTARRQAPRICERGLAGEEHVLKLELKLLADVGIIGFPNAGKSSLISHISAVKAKVADYPFTTLVPNLGVVDVNGKSQFVAVDIPGLIEGAHEGRGLGDRFLRHVERTRLLIHMIDLAVDEDGRDPIRDYEAIQEELGSFNPRLVKRPQIVVANKIDVVDEEAVEAARKLFAERDIEIWPVSVATGYGIRDLVMRAFRALQDAGPAKTETDTVRRRVYRLREEDTSFRVVRDEDGLVVYGDEVEKLVRKLILNSQDSLAYFAERLEKMGVMKALRREGFKAGEGVRIGEMEFELEA